MRILIQETKKIIRPLPVVLCLITLLLFCLSVPKNHLQAKQLLNTEKYPDKFTIYDNYSVDILFHDFLLIEYGTSVSIDNMDDLIGKRTELLEQVDAAAHKDEVLLRTGTLFNRESAEFYAVIAPMENNSDTISEEDQIYEWSCINGQMQLDGTNYPIGFLWKMDAVIQTLKSGESYQVLPADIFPIMRQCISIIIGFIVASWVLVIPYGVTEARSGTQLIAFSTKHGRRSYIGKMSAALVLSFFIIGMGVFTSALLFSSIGANRYYDSEIISSLQEINLDITGFEEIKLIELYALLLGMTTIAGLSCVIIITIVSLSSRHAVSAIACSLPAIVVFSAWYIVYTQVALDFGDTTISLTSSCLWACLLVVVACVFSAGAFLRKYKQNY